MNRFLLPLACVLALSGCDPEVEVELAPLTPILADVDVFTGTDSLGFGVGSAFPGPALPFGMSRPGPDTRGASSTLWSLHCSGYRYTDEFIAGFSSMRLHGTGIPDYGVIALQPVVGWDTPKRTQREYKLAKDFESESAEPGFYTVELATDAGPARVDLTATPRAAHHRYTLPEGSGPDAGILLDLSHVLPENTFHTGTLVDASGDGVEWEGSVHFSGSYSGRHGGEVVYFVLRFDRAPTSSEVWRPGDDALGGADLLGAFLRFDTDGAPVVEAQLGLSFVDVDGARANLDAELPDWDFEGTRGAATQAWEDALSAYAIAGGEPDTRTNFATSAYHSMLMPTLFTDVDGRYRGFDQAVHTADGWTYYTDFSLWDTYRTLHPLMNLVAPDRQLDFVRSLLTMAEQGGGRVPRWPVGTGYTNGMVGDPGHIAIADALLHGIGADDLDPQDVLDRLLESTTHRDRWDQWDPKGWLAADQGNGSVAITLEFAWADAAVAELAEALGDPRAEALRARSQGYRELWDASTGFMRPKNADGTFVEPFDPLLQGAAYVEGTAWHYSFMAPHDPDGLIALFGGPEPFVDKLETFFLEALDEPEFSFPSAHYWHGNEPSIHAAYLFALAGRPDLTREWSRWIEDTRYFPGPDGLSGNDDAGTLAAWYVLSAAGLYPIAGTPDYVVGAPRFEAVRLGRGDTAVTIRDPLRVGIDTPSAPLVTTVDDVPVERSTVRWDQLAGGAEVRFFPAE